MLRLRKSGTHTSTSWDMVCGQDFHLEVGHVMIIVRSLVLLAISRKA